MVMEKHVCPYGLKSLHLLKHKGFKVTDHQLKSREETETFKEHQKVDTTPQAFIDGKRIGGYDDLRRYFGRPLKDPKAPTYKPVIAIFAVAAAMALAAGWAVTGALFTSITLQRFVAFAMCILAVQKLRDLEGFATMFLTYDLLGRHWVRYAWFYPFAEAIAGVLMLAGALLWLALPLALFIGSVGAVSVFYAVYIQKRELKCACTGASTNVPLGAVSLAENLMMVTAALWMLPQAARI